MPLKGQVCLYCSVCVAYDRVNMHSILGSFPEIGEIHLPHNKQLEPQKQIPLKEFFVSLQQITFHGRKATTFPAVTTELHALFWII